MATPNNPGMLPGPGTTQVTDTRSVVMSGAEYLPRGLVVDGSLSRDPLNTSYLDYLRPGMVMGRITATGLYRPSCIGALSVAYTTGGSGTSMTVSAATAVELARLGSSGTFTLTGPPTAAGTVVSTTITYSAVNTTTGVITITATDANYVVASWLGGVDGSQTPVCLIGNGSPIKVTDALSTSIDVEWPTPVIGGVIDSSQIVNYPSDTSLITWLEDALQERGRYVFDAKYIV